MPEHTRIIRYLSNGLMVLEFPLLAAYPGIRHAVFTRNGGHSRGPYRSLNVSDSTGDDPGAVMDNRQLIRNSMGGGELVFARQVHGIESVQIEKGFVKADGKGSLPPAADSLITTEPGKNLTIQVADCQAILIYDPIRQVVTNIHSGWRGSIRNIAGETVRRLAVSLGCNPRDMVAAVGPSLGPCCAEFVHYTREIPKTLWGYRLPGDRFDFWRMTVDQLMDSGIPRDRIQLSGWCTRCRTDLFFSYRKEPVTGRFAAVIGLT